MRKKSIKSEEHWNALKSKLRKKIYDFNSTRSLSRGNYPIFSPEEKLKNDNWYTKYP